jgi:hypothetical protein
MKTRPVYHLHRFDPSWGFVTESRVVGAEGSRVDERSSAWIAAESVTGS